MNDSAPHELRPPTDQRAASNFYSVTSVSVVMR